MSNPEFDRLEAESPISKEEFYEAHTAIIAEFTIIQEGLMSIEKQLEEIKMLTRNTGGK